VTIALLKLLDIALRALFFLIPLFLLDPRSAGQLGLLNTLVALSAFLVGFERYRVLQRQLAGADEAEARRLIKSIIPFFCVNYFLVAPILAVLIVLWLELTAYDAMLGLSIVIGEHLTNATYQLALASEKYRAYFLIALIKSLIGMSMLLGVIAFQGAGLSLEAVLEVWAGVSVLGFVAIACAAYRHGKSPALASDQWARSNLVEQYRTNAAYFIIGLVALCSVQIDRIIIGAVADLETAGIYFKNLFIAASVYQFVTITIHNRFILRVYQGASQGQYLQVNTIIKRESLRATMVYLAVAAAIIAAPNWTETLGLMERGALRAEYLIGLLLAFMLRTVGDHYCAFLNAYLNERSVLVAHLAAACIAALLNLVLTRSSGIGGTVTSVVIGSAILLVLSYWFHSRARVNTERTE
jgi:O-antigen/teichoic acid export membrane protein